VSVVSRGGASVGVRPVRAWRVLHAAPPAVMLETLLDAQRSSGMRPVIATLADAADSKGTLLTAWHEVRNWRQAIVDAEAAHTIELVHAHGFAAGMAAVRSFPAVVYDVDSFVENTGTEDAGGARPGLWLSRSFRVAEQFVIARAGAIVIHRPSLRAGMVERGAADENLFLIPPPDQISAQQLAQLYDTAYRRAAAKRGAGSGGSRITLQPIQVTP